MTALVQKRRVTEGASGGADEPAQAEQEFPRPRFPAGVVVPPTMLLVVLLGTALCLTAVGSTPPASSAVLSGVVLAVAAVGGFAALRALVVTPVRRLRHDLAAALLSRHRNGSIRASVVREIDDIAAATRWHGSDSGQAARWRLPLPLALVLLAVGLLGALILGYVLTGSRPALVVTALGGGTVLLVLGHVHVATVRPLRQLARQAEAIAAARDGAGAPEPIGPQRLDEVGAVAASLNRFLASVTTPTGPAAITALLPTVRGGSR